MTQPSDRLADVVRDIVAELSQTPAADIQGTDRLREDLGLDSLQSMELLSRVSETFDIDPDMEQVMAVETVDGVVAALAGHLAP
jgi:acyl carrier protein